MGPVLPIIDLPNLGMLLTALTVVCIRDSPGYCSKKAAAFAWHSCPRARFRSQLCQVVKLWQLLSSLMIFISVIPGKPGKPLLQLQGSCSKDHFVWPEA